ncbi:hypothetical protein BX600DRAFT_470367 [Xylariales sp. PMI_506]|nr:hypothetical protein BX600DRAFT_470367 [Xylariales sp. PMI_506]
MGKGHTKSRSGCKACKFRRIKCDESRPACVKCSQAGRACSFVDAAPRLPMRKLPVQQRPLSSPGPGTGPGVHIVLDLDVTKCTSTALEPLASEVQGLTTPQYAALHLQLLFYFEHDLSQYMAKTHLNVGALLNLFIREAMTSAYLMDEVLAYAAAHRSTVEKDVGWRRFYRNEATRLQTRALAGYNASPRDVTEDTCLHMFLFSSLMCHHILFDVIWESTSPLEAVLDGLVDSIGVHRGLNAVTARAWPMFSEDRMQLFLQSCLRNDEALKIRASGGDCRELLERLATGALDASSLEAHYKAVEILQGILDRLCSSVPLERHMLNAVQDWLINVPVEYMQCIKQRRPEALAVLAHYAVVLHLAASYWFVGDLGKRLVYLISRHLGPAWADWLRWPSQIVGLLDSFPS